MLYPQNSSPLSKDLFQNPTSEYRAAPFWSWNTKLDKEILEEQIGQLRDMGMGGFHIHSRIGLDVPYLGEEFMNLVAFCNQSAKDKNMKCWLYDEDKWPSGAGGGFVTSDPAFKGRFLLFSPRFYPNGYMTQATPKTRNRLAIAGEGELIARYEIKLERGCLAGYRVLSQEEPANEQTWFAYRVIAETSPWFNNQSYVDTLNPKAIERFVEVTHQTYFAKLGQDFSGSIPAIFTDEPQFNQKDNLSFAEAKEDLKIPFTDDLETGYYAKYQQSLLDSLPELFWELPDGQVSFVRYCYHDYISERFTEAFMDTIGRWCQAHHIMLSGHVMDEPTLNSQTKALGEAMRTYRSFQLPGIDILADRYEYNTAKQAQSVSRQSGNPGVMSELYGVTNWDYDFRGHKLQGDWQAALGITVRVPHLAWVSMGGEAKRDYPAPIDGHSPWYKQYPVIEDYFSRINLAMTRGQASVSVGVIHPIESYWLYYGPNEQTGLIRDELEENFANLTRWLLFGLIDFDFIAESLLPGQNQGIDRQLHVGKMNYDVILLPAMKTIRRSTLKILESFADQGGQVIFIGDIPKYVDAKPSDQVGQLLAKSSQIQFSKAAVLDKLAKNREIDIRSANGNRTENLIYQIRNDGDCKWLFIAPGQYVETIVIPRQDHLKLTIKGLYTVEAYDAVSGQINAVDAQNRNNSTHLTWDRYEHDSILLKLTRLTETQQTPVKLPAVHHDRKVSCHYFDSTVNYQLSEPNIVLLDKARYQLDDGEWQPEEELLRIDSRIRNQMGYAPRTESFPQPWLSPAPRSAEHQLTLSFTVESENEGPQITLASEWSESSHIFWNGQEIKSTKQGWYVDRCLKTKPLGSLIRGRNELKIITPYHAKTDLEWCYLLGDFGVHVIGKQIAIIKKPDQISFGDYARQFLPFYGGNVLYEYETETPACNLVLETPQYNAPVLEVLLDGKTKGNIYLSPYRLDLGQVSAGKHKITVISYGNRFNQFGQVHNCNPQELYFGPKTWRTEGNEWSYEYQLRPVGVLTTPKLYFE